MSARDHVQALLVDLAEAPEWTPSTLGERLIEAHNDEVTPLRDWVLRVDQLRVGRGAIEMHRRLRSDTPPPSVGGLDDSDALLLCMACLAASQRTPTAQPTLAAVSRALDQHNRREPDFNDEFVLAAGVALGRDQPVRDAVYAQAEVLVADRVSLHQQAAVVLDLAPGVRGSIRKFIGMEPDFSGGDWHRWARAITVYALLAPKA